MKENNRNEFKIIEKERNLSNKREISRKTYK